MLQGDRHLVHFVNVTGHSQTAYFDPVRLHDLRVQVQGPFRSARSVRGGKNLEVFREGDYASFVLPSLDEYELVALH
jgi:hypothetical protein